MIIIITIFFLLKDSSDYENNSRDFLLQNKALLIKQFLFLKKVVEYNFLIQNMVKLIGTPLVNIEFLFYKLCFFTSSVQLAFF